MNFRIRNSWRWLVALGAVFVPAVVTGALELPFTFKSGRPIKASEVNANFEALRAKLDSLSGGGVAPAIGTLTLKGVLTDAPVRKFSQSIVVPPSVGVRAKPQFSQVVVERDLGEGSPVVNLNAAQQKALPSATLVFGNLTIELADVLIASVAVATPRVGHPQEAISLGFASVTYTWQEGNQAARAVSFDVTKGTGGLNGGREFSFGLFPVDATPDAAYVPVSSFEHQLACTGASCKPQFAPFSIVKSVTADTLDTFGLVTSGAVNKSVNLDVFADAATVSNGIELEDAIVSTFALGTDATGALSEKVSFTYSTVTWTAGPQSAGWDVAASKGL
ncbi:MAG TPA: type VI secretion system tube protein Hcp [Polyangiaceae bacterium]|nr:type VI secretion system tube protein Hcp [Polyangiaceae bacterium]